MQSLVREWEKSAEATERVELWANGKIQITSAAGGFIFAEDFVQSGQGAALALGKERCLRVWDCASRTYL